MSIDAISWAWSVRGVSATEKLVLLRLADYADELWSCFPSHRKLVADCGISARSVDRALANLATKDLLVTQRRQRENGSSTSNRYRLTPQIHRLRPPQDAHPHQFHMVRPPQDAGVPPHSDGGDPRTVTPPEPAFDPALEPELPSAAPERKPSKSVSSPSEHQQAFEAIRQAVGWPDTLGRSHAARLGRVAAGLREATPPDQDVSFLVSRFAEAYHAHWPGIDLTPEAMLKHWPAFMGGQFTPATPKLGWLDQLYLENRRDMDGPDVERDGNALGSGLPEFEDDGGDDLGVEQGTPWAEGGSG